MAHVLEELQTRAIEREKKLKEKYGKSMGRQLIAGAEEAVDYSFQREKTVEWWIKYNRELEERL
jgi:hypothetical protein